MLSRLDTGDANCAMANAPALGGCGGSRGPGTAGRASSVAPGLGPASARRFCEAAARPGCGDAPIPEPREGLTCGQRRGRDHIRRPVPAVSGRDGRPPGGAVLEPRRTAAASAPQRRLAAARGRMRSSRREANRLRPRPLGSTIEHPASDARRRVCAPHGGPGRLRCAAEGRRATAWEKESERWQSSYFSLGSDRQNMHDQSGCSARPPVGANVAPRPASHQKSKATPA